MKRKGMEQYKIDNMALLLKKHHPELLVSDRQKTETTSLDKIFKSLGIPI